jgi:hypothetical protein
LKEKKEKKKQSKEKNFIQNHLEIESSHRERTTKILLKRRRRRKRREQNVEIAFRERVRDLPTDHRVGSSDQTSREFYTL